MGFWIFRNDGELDNRYGVVRDGKNALYLFLGVIVIFIILAYFILTYLFAILPIAISIVGYNYLSKNFKTPYRLLIVSFFLLIYSLSLYIMTEKQFEKISYGNYKFIGDYKMESSNGMSFTTLYAASKYINIFSNSSFKNFLETDTHTGNSFKINKLIEFANENSFDKIEFKKITHTDRKTVDRYYYGKIRYNNYQIPGDGYKYVAELILVFDGDGKSYSFVGDNPVYEIKTYNDGIKNYVNFDDDKYVGGIIFSFKDVMLCLLISGIFSVLLANAFTKSKKKVMLN